MELLVGLKDYFRLLREQAQDSSLRAAHELEANRNQVMKILNFVTGIFMWSYTLVSYLYMKDPAVWEIGFACSFLHSFSYLIYKKSKSFLFGAYVLVATGGIFQTSFAIYNGGFYSSTLIWVAILPLIMGVVTNIFHTVIWFCISIFFFIVAFIITKMGWAQNVLDPRGEDLVQFMISCGLIFLVSGFTVIALRLGQIYRKNLLEKNFQVQSLLRTLSHDLATPLTLIRFGIERSQNGEPSAEMVQKMDRAAKNIFDILDHVRRVDALDSGKLVFDVSRIRLHPIIHDCRVFFEEMANRKGVHLDFHVPTDVYIQGNSSVLVNHVLGNLISNSIKFSESGGRIVIRSEIHDGRVDLVVRDFGVGIAQKRLDSLFVAGKANSTRGTANEAGTGFGMLLVKSYLEAMGAQISVRSWTESTSENGEFCERGTRVVLSLLT